MKAARLIVRNLREFKRNLEKEDSKRKKTADTATRVETFRLTKELKSEIQAGAPGGQSFEPLTEIAKRTSGKGLRRTALKRLTIPIRYAVTKTGETTVFSVGYVEPGKGPGISKSWKRIATFQQTGGKVPVSEERRAALAAIGRKLQQRRRPEARFFFLKKSTIEFRIPPRPIIGPFWQAHQHEVFRNIKNNFERKMAGERI